MAFGSRMSQFGLAVALAVSGVVLAAQAPASTVVPKSAIPAKKAHAKKRKAVKVEAPPEVVEAPKPPEPVMPNWPANAQAEQAAVQWDGSQLTIAATNSSLHQILHDVSTATGVKVDGIGGDQRVFGQYGPASARDVLSQLLEGTGYNVLMIGGQGTGTPRQVLLSNKGATAPKPQANDNQTTAPPSDAEAPEEPEPEPPPMNQPMAVPPQQPQQGPMTGPQQMIQQLQQRQQQLQDLQQQQQQQGQQQPQQPNE